MEADTKMKSTQCNYSDATGTFRSQVGFKLSGKFRREKIPNFFLSTKLSVGLKFNDFSHRLKK